MLRVIDNLQKNVRNIIIVCVCVEMGCIFSSFQINFVCFCMALNLSLKGCNSRLINANMPSVG